MDDPQFDRLKQATETELGRAIDADEEHALKMLYYFGKGVKLKAQFESGPVHISEILPGVLSDIERRMKQPAGSLVNRKHT